MNVEIFFETRSRLCQDRLVLPNAHCPENLQTRRKFRVNRQKSRKSFPAYRKNPKKLKKFFYWEVEEIVENVGISRNIFHQFAEKNFSQQQWDRPSFFQGFKTFMEKFWASWPWRFRRISKVKNFYFDWDLFWEKKKKKNNFW